VNFLFCRRFKRAVFCWLSGLLIKDYPVAIFFFLLQIYKSSSADFSSKVRFLAFLNFRNEIRKFRYGNL